MATRFREKLIQWKETKEIDDFIKKEMRDSFRIGFIYLVLFILSSFGVFAFFIYLFASLAAKENVLIILQGF